MVQEKNDGERPEPMDAFFDARAEGYDEHMRGLYDEDIYGKLASFLPRTGAPLRVFDPGCGTGLELGPLWERMPNARVTCLDLSRGMLDILIRNHPDRQGQLEIVEASYLDWAYPAGTFDIALSSMTMHHLTPAEKLPVYRKLRSTLKKGGFYLESDFVVDAAQAAQYRWQFELLTAGMPDAAGGRLHIDIPCTVEEQLALLRGAGFAPVKVLDAHIGPGAGSRAILRADTRGKEPV